MVFILGKLYSLSMEYSSQLTKQYSRHRNRYRSTDKLFFPMVENLGVKDKVILDFGCGQGVDAVKLVNLGAKQVIGVDPSKAMIELAQALQSHERVSYIKNNGLLIPLNDDSVDLVFSNFAIHYVKDVFAQFKEIARVLKPNGYLIGVFNCLTTDLKLVNKIVPMRLGRDDWHTQVQIFAKAPLEIKRALQDASMNLIRFDKVDNPDAQIDPSF